MNVLLHLSAVALALTLSACDSAVPPPATEARVAPATPKPWHAPKPARSVAPPPSGPRLDRELQMKAMNARNFVALGRVDLARKAYAELLNQWQDAVREPSYPGDPPSTAHSEVAISAVSEALFFAAEQERAAAEALAMPAFSGDGSEKSIRQHLDDQVKPWATKKEAMMKEAEAAYAKVAALGGVAPQWLVDSSARIGTMHATFVAQYRAPALSHELTHADPVGHESQTTREQVRRIYYQTLDEASQAEKARAIEAFAKCQADAASLNVQDELVDECNAWLAKNQ